MLELGGFGEGEAQGWAEKASPAVSRRPQPPNPDWMPFSGSNCPDEPRTLAFSPGKDGRRGGRRYNGRHGR